MPSRWQKKSQEEQARIAKQQKGIHDYHVKSMDELNHQLKLRAEEESEIKRIYETGKIPQLCMRCYNYCFCDVYYIGKIVFSPQFKMTVAMCGHPVEDNELSIGGICSECKGATCRNWAPDLVMFPLYPDILAKHEKAGKLIRGPEADKFLQAAWDSIIKG